MEGYKSIYKRAAEDGIPLGIYLTAMALAVIYVDMLPQLAVLWLTMAFGLPFFTYAMLRRCYVAEYGFTRFSALWMLGVLAFIYASLITALISYGVLSFFRPGYFYDLALMWININEKTPNPEVADAVEVMRRIVDGNMLPRTIELVMCAFWSMSFIGSMLSAPMAFVVRRVPLKGNVTGR